MADVGGLTRSETDQYLQREMLDDDERSVTSTGLLPVWRSVNVHSV